MRRIWKISIAAWGARCWRHGRGRSAAGHAAAGQVRGLRARANPETETPSSPPAPYALELAEYAVKVGPESARVAQTLRLTLYDDQWQTVPLGEAGSFIAADFKGGEGRVEVSDKGL